MAGNVSEKYGTDQNTIKRGKTMNYVLPNEPWKPINVNEIPEIEEKLKHAHGPEILELKSLYDGPDHGLDYHEETGKFTIANGWHIEANGDIVRD